MDPASAPCCQVTVEQAALADEVCSVLMGEDVEQRRHFIQTNARTCGSSTSSGRDADGHDATDSDADGTVHAGRDNEGQGPEAPRRRTGLHRAHRDQGGDGAVLPRVLDVGHRLAGAARRARRAEAGPPPDPLLDVRPAACCPTDPTPSAPRSSARSWARSTPTATRRSTRPWPGWSQDFSMRHPLIDGHGNFGGTGPDEGPAAMRYTECRLGPLALELLSGIDQETVDFVAQLRRHRPRSRRSCRRGSPNMLVNGSQGIAVGMATNIPPHNLGEVIDATTHLLEHPDATPDDLMAFIKGPDFPTGALILGRQGILDALRTGPRLDQACAPSPRSRRGATAPRGSSSPRCPTRRRSRRSRRRSTTSCGPATSTASPRPRTTPPGGKTRLVIRLKRDANANVVLNNLFKQTPMQTTFSVNAVALVDGVPRTLNVAQMLDPLRGAPGRGGDPAVRVPAGQGPGAGPRGRGPAQGHRHAGPGHRHHPRVGRPAGRPRGPVGDAVRLLGGAGQPHPRHDAWPGSPGWAGPNLEEEMAKLLEEIAELESILNDDAKLRGVIAGELGEIREKFANERRTDHHPRSGRHERRGPGGRRGDRRHA